ncbi:hypothetical protein ACPV5S_19320 [Vibrio astriarenae]
MGKMNRNLMASKEERAQVSHRLIQEFEIGAYKNQREFAKSLKLPYSTVSARIRNRSRCSKNLISRFNEVLNERNPTGGTTGPISLPMLLMASKIKNREVYRGLWAYCKDVSLEEYLITTIGEELDVERDVASSCLKYVESIQSERL